MVIHRKRRKCSQLLSNLSTPQEFYFKLYVLCVLGWGYEHVYAHALEIKYQNPLGLELWTDVRNQTQVPQQGHQVVLITEPTLLAPAPLPVFLCPSSSFSSSDSFVFSLRKGFTTYT